MMLFLHSKLRCCAWVVAVAATFTLPARAEDAKAFFNSLYANRVRQVKATADHADDIALAKEMLTTVAGIERTDVVSLICDAVVDLTQRHPDGIHVAVDALKLLGDRVQSRQAEAQKKTIDLFMRESVGGSPNAKLEASQELVSLFTLGADEEVVAGNYDEALAQLRQAMAAAQRAKLPAVDEIKLKTDRVLHLSRTQKEIDRFRVKLLADANDTASAQALVRLFTVDLDKPADAAKYIDRAKDPQLQKLVPLAARGIDIETADLLALGEWYLTQAGTAAAPAKEAMWRRASSYFGRYLESQQGDALGRTKAQVLLKTADDSLAKAAAQRVKDRGEARWISEQATYKASSQHDRYAALPGLLNGGKGLYDGAFAFHTASTGPGNIVIDLGKPMLVSRMWIKNRTDCCSKNAKGMTVSFSLEPKVSGRAVWTAQKPEAEWTVKLGEAKWARYVTFQQAPEMTSFHLVQVKLFGWKQ